MNIEQVVDGLNEWIQEQGAREFVSGQLVQAKLGAQHSITHTNGSPPAIVVYPDTETFLQPHDPGAVANDPRGKGRGNPKAIRDVVLLFQFECWGADFDATERLRNLIIRGFQAMTEPHFAPGTGKWNRDTKLAAFGVLYTLPVGVRFPILGKASHTVQAVPAAGPAPVPGTETNIRATVELDAGGTNPEPPIDVNT